MTGYEFIEHPTTSRRNNYSYCVLAFSDCQSGEGTIRNQFLIIAVLQCLVFFGNESRRRQPRSTTPHPSTHLCFFPVPSIHPSIHPSPTPLAHAHRVNALFRVHRLHPAPLLSSPRWPTTSPNRHRRFRDFAFRTARCCSISRGIWNPESGIRRLDSIFMTRFCDSILALRDIIRYSKHDFLDRYCDLTPLLS